MQVSCGGLRNKKAIRLWESIGKWADSDVVNRNIQSPYQAAMSMFESRFHMPMEYAALLSADQGGAFLTSGNINMFVKDLYSYSKRVDSGKFSEFEVAEGFMTGTVLGKRDPVLADSLKKLRKVVDSDKKRSNKLNQDFKNLVDKIRSVGGMTGTFSNAKINSALKNHRKLELEHIKALDIGSQEDKDIGYENLKDFESKGSIKTFVDFIKVVEERMPEAIMAKYNAEKAIADRDTTKKLSKKEKSKIYEARKVIKSYDDGEKLVRLTDDESIKYFREAGISEDVIGPLTDYNNLMSEAYKVLRSGINEKINIHIKQVENRKGFGLTVENLNKLKESMRSELMPKYKEDGYFPHFTKELNAKMMDSMMRHFDELDNSIIDMKHDSKSINQIIDDIKVAIPNYAKARTRGDNYDYSKNFIDVVNTYINDINKFNTQVFVKSNLIDSLSKARKVYDQESEYSKKIVDIIDSLYGSVNGQIKGSGSMHEIKKALLSYQFTNKLGFSVRSAARNATQYLMNYATFGYTAVRESRKYLKDNQATEVFGGDLDEFLKRENLFMETSEALIESGVKADISAPYKLRRMNEDGKIIYADEGDLIYKGIKTFSSGMGKLAKWSSIMHRKVENANRKLTAEIAFAQIQKTMDDSIRFKEYITQKSNLSQDTDKPKSVRQLKREIARNYAKNMVILNHFDYESYAKARHMREGVGQFMFQFQHYGMEFLERNYSIYKEAKGDLSVLGDDKFSNWVKDARGVHKMMNVATAYLMAPALISYISGYNQTLIEHTGKELLDDLWLLMTTDYDDPEAIEKLNREFYGKGIVGSKLGPTFGTILDIGIATELINADSEYLDNVLLTAGDFANDDTVGKVGQWVRLVNQMAGRTYDRYIPMATKTPYGLGAAAMQELTLYPKKSREKTIYRDVIESEIKDQFPSYYFDKLHKKSKRQKYSGLPIEVQNSLLRLEQEGKKS